MPMHGAIFTRHFHDQMHVAQLLALPKTTEGDSNWSWNRSRRINRSVAMQGDGRASKFGNRFEGRWTIRRLLQVLSGEIRTVRIEPIGEDEPGVDLWIRDRGDALVAEQCKRQDGTEAGWTVNRLRAIGVLDYAKQQLERSERITYRFVSATPAGTLKDLSERASSSDSPHDLADQIAKHSTLGKAFTQLCNAWGLDGTTGAPSAILLLARCHWDTFPDGVAAEDDEDGVHAGSSSCGGGACWWRPQ